MIFMKTLFSLALSKYPISEAATQRCSYKKVFWKYAANLQENTNVIVWF